MGIVVANICNVMSCSLYLGGLMRPQTPLAKIYKPSFANISVIE